MTIAIVGSRDYPRFDLVRAHARSLPPGITEVSDHGGTVDLNIEHKAFACGLAVIVFPAEWSRYGLSTGPIRDAEFVAGADRVIAYWDREPRGTLDTVRETQAAKMPVAIIGPDERSCPRQGTTSPDR